MFRFDQVHRLLLGLVIVLLMASFTVLVDGCERASALEVEVCFRRHLRTGRVQDAVPGVGVGTDQGMLRSCSPLKKSFEAAGLEVVGVKAVRSAFPGRIAKLSVLSRWAVC